MIRYGKGKTAVTLEGLEAKEIEASLKASFGPVIDALQSAAEKVISAAEKTWPIKTGASKDSFYTVITLSSDTKIEVSILNKQPYVPYIKSTKVGKEEGEVRNRAPLQTEIKGPAKVLQKELKLEIPKIFSEFIKF